ncbi:MAG: hypothetical protein AVDCRST_MAG68-5519, partial [uncultured Gemmatimonadetes bacterium]
GHGVRGHGGSPDGDPPAPVLRHEPGRRRADGGGPGVRVLGGATSLGPAVGARVGPVRAAAGAPGGAVRVGGGVRDLCVRAVADGAAPLAAGAGGGRGDGGGGAGVRGRLHRAQEPRAQPGMALGGHQPGGYHRAAAGLGVAGVGARGAGAAGGGAVRGQHALRVEIPAGGARDHARRAGRAPARAPPRRAPARAHPPGRSGAAADLDLRHRDGGVLRLHGGAGALSGRALRAHRAQHRLRVRVERGHLRADARARPGPRGGPPGRGAALPHRPGAAGGGAPPGPAHLAHPGCVGDRGDLAGAALRRPGGGDLPDPRGHGVHLPLRHLPPLAGDLVAGEGGDDGRAADLRRGHARAGAAVGGLVVRPPGHALPLLDQRRAGAGDDLLGAGDRGTHPRGPGREPHARL